ncbi:MAG: GWxTD domain-containing protein [Patiriisocius sp.]
MKVSFVFLIAVLTFSCTNNRYVGVAKMKDYYPIQDNNPPEYKIYSNADSMMLYFRIPAASITENLGGQKYKTRLRVELYTDFTKKTLIDSIGFDVISSFKNVESKQMIEGEVKLDLVDNDIRPLVVQLYSNTEKSNLSPRLLYLDSLENDDSNFMLLDGDNKVIPSNFVTDGGELKLVAGITEGSDMLLEVFEINRELPRPPFSSYVPPPHQRKPLDSKVLKIDGGQYKFSCPEQSFIEISSIDNPEIRTSVFRFDESYPDVQDVDFLVDALRYITTEEEYEVIYNSENKKEAIDSFWLSCAGSKERARKLIKNYYGRVAFSNRYFTSHVPGWKSDRGLIYMIFGPPQSIFISVNREFWHYGQDGSMDNISFEFVKAKNPYTDSDFRLIRNEIYKPNWYRVVSAWRDGRMFYE